MFSAAAARHTNTLQTPSAAPKWLCLHSRCVLAGAARTDFTLSFPGAPHTRTAVFPTAYKLIEWLRLILLIKKWRYVSLRCSSSWPLMVFLRLPRSRSFLYGSPDFGNWLNKAKQGRRALSAYSLILAVCCL